jgi:hypothetical protein
MSAQVLVALLVVWVVAGSAARVPVFALIGKFSPSYSFAWLNNTSLLGLGLASALAPYMAARLRDTDPFAPFVAASVGLLIAMWALAFVMRRGDSLGAFSTASGAGSNAASGTSSTGVASAPMVLAGLALIALGVQVHTALNSAPLYLRFAGRESLEGLMPIFWIAFNLGLLPAAWLGNVRGAAGTLLSGAALGTAGLASAAMAPSLAWLAVAQCAAGLGWSLVIGSVLTVAMSAGRSGREGRNTGAVFALLALAAVVRLSLVVSEIAKEPDYVQVLMWMPAVLWALAVMLLVAGVGNSERRK